MIIVYKYSYHSKKNENNLTDNNNKDSHNIYRPKINKRKSIMTNPIKKINFCKIFPVYCMDKNKRITGYSLYIKYLKLKFKFGPFKHYKFVSDLKAIIQNDIEHLKCTRQNYLNVIPDYVNMKQEELSKSNQILEIYSKKGNYNK